MRASHDRASGRRQRSRVLLQGLLARCRSAQICVDGFHLQELRTRQSHGRVGQSEEELQLIGRSRANHRLCDEEELKGKIFFL